MKGSISQASNHKFLAFDIEMLNTLNTICNFNTVGLFDALASTLSPFDKFLDIKYFEFSIHYVCAEHTISTKQHALLSCLICEFSKLGQHATLI